MKINQKLIFIYKVFFSLFKNCLYDIRKLLKEMKIISFPLKTFRYYHHHQIIKIFMKQFVETLNDS